jgi:transcriptional regulator
VPGFGTPISGSRAEIDGHFGLLHSGQIVSYSYIGTQQLEFGQLSGLRVIQVQSGNLAPNIGKFVTTTVRQTIRSLFGGHILTAMMKKATLARIFFGVSMDEPNTDVIQGTLDMLILKTLSLEPMHGFGIARRIEQVSKGVFKVNPGSLLTAFQRLERVGWLDSEWRQTENSRRAKFYSLNRSGRKQLEVETANWNRRASAIARLLKAEG